MSTETIAHNSISHEPQEQLQKGIIQRSGILHYLIDARVVCLEYEERKLADELEEYLIESLIQDIFYAKNYIMRVSALQQLTSWIDQYKIKRIFSIIAKNEKNPELREFASTLLGALKQ